MDGCIAPTTTRQNRPTDSGLCGVATDKSRMPAISSFHDPKYNGEAAMAKNSTATAKNTRAIRNRPICSFAALRPPVLFFRRPPPANDQSENDEDDNRQAWKDIGLGMMHDVQPAPHPQIVWRLEYAADIGAERRDVTAPSA